MAVYTWVGGAQAVKQITTVTCPAPSATDYLEIGINGKTIKVTFPTGKTAAEAATAMVAAWNGDAAVADETRTETGNNIAEMSEINAVDVAASADFTLESESTVGEPFTIDKFDHWDGIVNDLLGANVALTQSPTGPNWYDNNVNWVDDQGAIPASAPSANTDDIVFDRGDIDCLYGLVNSTQPATFRHYMGYSGEIGLGNYKVLADGTSYREYRTKSLTYQTDMVTSIFDLGLGDGPGSRRIRIDMDDAECKINVRNAGQRIDTDVPVILITGGAVTSAANEVNVSRGDVGLAFYPGETFECKFLRVNYVENQPQDAQVHCGPGVDFVTPVGGQISQIGGHIVVRSTTYNSGTPANSPGVLLQHGTSELADGAHNNVIIEKNHCVYTSTGTAYNIECGNEGVIDCRPDIRERTFETCKLYSGSSLYDPAKSIKGAGGGDFDPQLILCRLTDITLDLGSNMVLTRSALPP